MTFPDKRQQVLATHAAFVRQVVALAGDAARSRELQTLLDSATRNGWGTLVRAVRAILNGRRDPALLQGLDEEDQILAEAVLRGLQDPATLPKAPDKADAALAAPGLAHMIHAAATGNAQALVLIGNMADQMAKVGGDMTQLAGRIRPLINGERDPDRLCKGMGGRGRLLLLGILDELAKLEVH
ncbi:MAG: hypothetical protein RLZ44_1555 [Pseudomonadota bacterium]|jgi:hypothetical protein